MKNKKLLVISAIVPLLMGAALNTKFYSDVLGRNLSESVVERIIKDGYHTESVLTNADDVMFDVRIDYEFLKMGHGLLYTSWAKTYTVLYRISVTPKATVKYKTGWWIFATTKQAPSYISTISASLSLGNVAADYQLIYNNPDYVFEPLTYDIDSLAGKAVGFDSLYNGGYYISMYNYDKAIPNVDRGNTFYMSVASTASNTAYFDVLENSLFSYSRGTTYYFGSLSFTSSTDPTNVRLKTDITCGAKPTTSLLTSGKSDKLTEYEVTKLRNSGFQPIKTSYDYTMNFNKTFTLN